MRTPRPAAHPWAPDALWICLGIGMLTVAVYARVAGFPFIILDDESYVWSNPHVRDGLSLAGVQWAFTHTQHGNWHPLAMISHMLDCSLFGLWAGGHHLVNVFLHTANSLLLFLILRATTGARWRSAFVAALFALHPLRVESVVWVAERKDVLSTFFWMLTVRAYVASVRRPSWRRSGLVVGLYVLALLSKPMVVTLPLVLLLLDVWPLRRLGGVEAGRGVSLSTLVREKLPLFALSVAVAVVTVLGQWAADAMPGLAHLSLSMRLANLPGSYLSYLLKAVWPVGLAVMYPYEFDPQPPVVVGAAALLIGVTGAVIWAGARHRYALVGWLWFLVTLLPVSGLLQAGEQSIADRYTYVPVIGLFILVAWGVPAAFERCRHGRAVLPSAAIGVVAACIPLTWVQVGHWRSSQALFQRTIDVTEENLTAYLWLAKALARDGRQQPDAARAYYNAGNIAVRRQAFDDAATCYRDALALLPEWPEAQHNLGIALASAGRLEDAIGAYDAALRVRPDFVDAMVSRGLALAASGRVEEATREYQRALALQPGSPAAQRALAELQADRPAGVP